MLRRKPNLPSDNIDLSIKRIAGIPGDTVGIFPPYICIDGNPLKYPPIFTKISDRKDGYSGFDLVDPVCFPKAMIKSKEGQVALSDGEYFLVGDNTAASYDSRHYGAVNDSAIQGRVIYVLLPVDRRGVVQ